MNSMLSLITHGPGSIVKAHPRTCIPLSCILFICCMLPACSGNLSSVHQDNPLYEEQEIRMEMFNEGSDDETEGMIMML